MNLVTKQQALHHAQIEFPRESCGLVVIIKGKEHYRPCRNLAERHTQFILDPKDYQLCEDEGDITAVVHSHPNLSAKPSQADLVGCEFSGLPWYIVSLPSGIWERIEPTGYQAPLIGREFTHGVLDCYSLVQDFYREKFNIELPNYDRADEWWKKGQDLYMVHFQEAGFDPIDASEIQAGDVLLMQIHSKVVNHAAIYLGGDLMLHHAMNRLSCREVWGGWWKKNTRLVVRYRGTP
jgi:proteasome lid subunit RPN8/RPN11